MRKTFEVVDDFHPNPTAVRARALAGDPAGVDADSLSRVAAVLGAAPDRIALGPDAGRVVHRGADVPADERPRTDPAEWVAVVCLSATPPPGAGISLWRAHPESGDWFESAFVPLRFNRAVLLRAASVRRGLTAGFGLEPADGWLCQEYDFDLRPVAERAEEGNGRAK
ncbi:hypothetical protein JOD54_001886 [Actinokineospora baliensis]|uniref:hypothetical protein n=1 Tax=Actinokineospora baliensis TaxID=547056 RepID=UPI001956459A|nr:hypothetical protein [Actinokineospora baliensis]MBM7771682.1 hypothetical protein [Actinokineospora baliensis]